MFTQKISMDCTREQYEKYLKDELLKMGYNDAYVTFRGRWEGLIANNTNGDMGDLGSLFSTSKLDYGRTYLGSFNAELFLALAAMTDKAEGNYGEYWRPIDIHLTYLNDWYMQGATRLNQSWRKATKEEIMAKFSEKEAILPTIAIDITNNSDEKRCYYGSEEQMIALLKSRGYKIMRKIENWEEV